jgi:ubiquinone/menaquinone biosynthesis C-methylase UbiE
MIYDAIYRARGKDYAAEAERICTLVQQHKGSQGNTLLDVACGTGNHIAYLREKFDVEGLDNSQEMLEAARAKFPGCQFHHADMVDFDLGRRFDVITCLFSAIGYVQTHTRLFSALKTFARHLQPGGMTIIEPWFEPGVLESGKIHATFVDEPELKIARMNVSRVEGNLSYLDFRYLLGTPKGIEDFSETHVLGVFTSDQYLQAFREAGLRTLHDEAGLDGRGLYIGVKEP